MNVQKTAKKASLILLSGVMGVAAILPTFSVPARAAACQAPSTNYGTATSTISIPSTGTYRLWSRIMAPDTTNKSYLLEIDGNTCYNVGGGNIPANTWTWVDYQGGNTGSKAQQSLTQGSHTVKFIGNAPGVKIDRLIALSNLSCVPTGTGDDCNQPDDTQTPTVSLTAPSENAIVKDTVTVSASASDNVGVTKVEFYDNSTLLGTDTGSPYSVTWDTTKAAGGEHLITAKAYDAAGNVSTDANTVVVQNGDSQVPTTPTEVSVTAPAHNKAVLKWKASTDNVGVVGYIVMRNGSSIVQTGAVVTYEDTTTLPNTKYNYQLIALDAAGNRSAASAVVSVTTPNVPDTQAPTKPTALKATTESASQISLLWQPSTDNIGVAGYDVFMATGTGAARKINNALVTSTSFSAANLDANTDYTFYIEARDAAGNVSPQSDKASAKTRAKSKVSVIKGKITDKDTGKSLARARVAVNIGKFKQVYRTSGNGKYTLRLPSSGRYSVTYSAFGYSSQTKGIQTKEGQVFVQDIALTKKR